VASRWSTPSTSVIVPEEGRYVPQRASAGLDPPSEHPIA
jgi:hypothetical protein